MASKPASSITDTTGDPDIVAALKDEVSETWNDTLPRYVLSALVLEEKKWVLPFPDEGSIAFQAGGRLGSSESTIMGYVRRPIRQPVNFAVVATVSSEDVGQLFEESYFSSQVKAQLPCKAFDLCVFRNWPGIAEARSRDISSQPKATHALQVLQDFPEVLGWNKRVDPSAPFTGISVQLKVNLNEWASSPSARYLQRLTDIDQLTGTTSIKELVMNCSVSKEELSNSQPTIYFSSQILEPFTIIDNVALTQDVRLTFSAVRHLFTSLSLWGRLELGIFDPRRPWIAEGSLVIDQYAYVKLTALPTPYGLRAQEQAMVELGAIKLYIVGFTVEYHFGQASLKREPSLCVDVEIGDIVARTNVVFDGPRPSLLLFDTAKALGVGELFTTILNSPFPDDFLDISLTDLSFAYSWNHTALIRPEQPTVEPGFTATARTDVFGIAFDALLRLIPIGSDKMIFATGKLLSPLNIGMGSLYERNNVTAGPLITYEAKVGVGSHLTINCGLSILDLHFPDIRVRYGKSVNDKQPCLQVDLTLNSPAVRGGRAPVNLEFVKVEDRTHLRLNSIPLREVRNAFDGTQLFDEIRDLTNWDIDYPHSDPQDVVNTWSPTVELSERQLGMYDCSFDVSCTWSLKLLDDKVVEMTMKPFSLAMLRPDSWEDLLTAITQKIVDEKRELAQSLLDDVEKFSEILTILAADDPDSEETKGLLRAWLWFHKDAGVPNPGPGLVPVGLGPPPQPIKLTRFLSDGYVIKLTDDLQDVIMDLRKGARTIIDCLECILLMLGAGDPTKVMPNPRPKFPILSVSDADKEKYIKWTNLLLGSYIRIRDRTWDPIGWKEFYRLVTNPWGSEWPDIDLVVGLRELETRVGTIAKAYEFSRGFLARSYKPTWPEDGSPDPRPEVEVFRKVHNIQEKLRSLTEITRKVAGKLESMGVNLITT